MYKKVIQKSGIICYRINNKTKRIEFAIILKNYTQDFIRLLLGRYSLNNPVKIEKFTVFEKMLLIKYQFTDLFYFYFKGSRYFDKQAISNAEKKYKKFIKRFNGKFDGYLIETMTTNYKDNSPMWEIPKGKKKYDEDFIKCAIREFTEETTIKDISLIRKFKPLMEYERFNGVTFKTKYFLASVKYNDVHVINNTTNEITLVAWMAIEDINNLRMTKQKRDIMKCAHSLIQTNILKNKYT
jgi:8-oxo-dGTP pyrophosphatase MutT (NUDIX family)